VRWIEDCRHVGKISLWNSKRLLGKLQKNFTALLFCSTLYNTTPLSSCFTLRIKSLVLWEQWNSDFILFNVVTAALTRSITVHFSLSNLTVPHLLPDFFAHRLLCLSVKGRYTLPVRTGRKERPHIRPVRTGVIFCARTSGPYVRSILTVRKSEFLTPVRDTRTIPEARFT